MAEGFVNVVNSEADQSTTDSLSPVINFEPFSFRQGDETHLTESESAVVVDVNHYTTPVETERELYMHSQASIPCYESTYFDPNSETMSPYFSWLGSIDEAATMNNPPVARVLLNDLPDTTRNLPSSASHYIDFVESSRNGNSRQDGYQNSISANSKPPLQQQPQRQRQELSQLSKPRKVSPPVSVGEAESLLRKLFSKTMCPTLFTINNTYDAAEMRKLLQYKLGKINPKLQKSQCAMQFLEALTRGDFNIDIMRMGYKLDDFPYAQAGPNIKCTNFAVTAHLKPASTRQPGNRATEICALVGSSAPAFPASVSTGHGACHFETSTSTDRSLWVPVTDGQSTRLRRVAPWSARAYRLLLDRLSYLDAVSKRTNVFENAVALNEFHCGTWSLATEDVNAALNADMNCHWWINDAIRDTTKLNFAWKNRNEVQLQGTTANLCERCLSVSDNDYHERRRPTIKAQRELDIEAIRSAILDMKSAGVTSSKRSGCSSKNIKKTHSGRLQQTINVSQSLLPLNTDCSIRQVTTDDKNYFDKDGTALPVVICRFDSQELGITLATVKRSSHEQLHQLTDKNSFATIVRQRHVTTSSAIMKSLLRMSELVFINDVVVSDVIASSTNLHEFRLDRFSFNEQADLVRSLQRPLYLGFLLPVSKPCKPAAADDAAVN